jgi:hypothetical protein
MSDKPTNTDTQKERPPTAEREPLDAAAVIASSQANASAKPVSSARYIVAVTMSERGPLADGTAKERCQAFARELQRALDGGFFTEIRYDALDFAVAGHEQLGRDQARYRVEIVMNEEHPNDARSDAEHREALAREFVDALDIGYFAEHHSGAVEVVVLSREVLHTAPAGEPAVLTLEGYDWPELGEADREIVRWRVAANHDRQGPQTGDFVRFSDGVVRRISYVWPEDVQTSDQGFYHLLDTGGVSMSGSHYLPVKLSTLSATAELREGEAWISRHESKDTDGRVTFKAPFRVFACREPAPR